MPPILPPSSLRFELSWLASISSHVNLREVRGPRNGVSANGGRVPANDGWWRLIGTANGPIEGIDWPRPGPAFSNDWIVKSSGTAYLALALAAVLGRPAATAAQTAATPTPTFSVSITEASELVEEVGTTRRIGRAEIEARSARTLDEALRLLPGIYVRTGGDGTPRIDMRGFRSRHVLLLINGVPANSTADGQFDPARISTERHPRNQGQLRQQLGAVRRQRHGRGDRDHDDRREARGQCERQRGHAGSVGRRRPLCADASATGR